MSADSPPVIPDPRPLEGEWVTIPQIADIAGVQTNAVNQWRNRFADSDLPFPVEDDAIGAFPVWRLERVIAWLQATGRDRLPTYDLDGFRAKRDAGHYRRGGKKDEKLNARWRDRKPA
jgi:hypothetical protein